MYAENYLLTQADRSVIELLRDFVPKQVFDAHMHLYRSDLIPNFAKTGVFIRDAASAEDYLKDMRPFLPGAERIRLNIMPMLDWAMTDSEGRLRDEANAYTGELLSWHPEHVGAAYVLPADSEQKIGDMVSSKGIRAIKVYCYGDRTCGPDWEGCRIGSFLPESAWAVANQKRLPIILHMMRPKALADDENFDYIVRMARCYPNAKLVLAHCGRGFAAWTLLERINALAKIENIWYDLAAVCEAAPVAACVMRTSGKRVVWGSDYPINMYRGRAISLSSGQLWLTGDQLKNVAPQGSDACLLAGENLMAVRRAALLLDLDRTQIDDLFYNNAIRMLGLEEVENGG